MRSLQGASNQRHYHFLRPSDGFCFFLLLLRPEQDDRCNPGVLCEVWKPSYSETCDCEEISNYLKCLPRYSKPRSLTHSDWSHLAPAWGGGCETHTCLDRLPSNTHCSRQPKGAVLTFCEPFQVKVHAHPARQAQSERGSVVEKSSSLWPPPLALHLAAGCISPSYTGSLSVLALSLTVFPVGQGWGNFLHKGSASKQPRGVCRLCWEHAHLWEGLWQASQRADRSIVPPSTGNTAQISHSPIATLSVPARLLGNTANQRPSSLEGGAVSHTLSMGTTRPRSPSRRVTGIWELTGRIWEENFLKSE